MSFCLFDELFLLCLLAAAFVLLLLLLLLLLLFPDGFILLIIFRVACTFWKLYFQYFHNTRGEGSLDMLHNLFFLSCLLYRLVNGVD